MSQFPDRRQFLGSMPFLAGALANATPSGMFVALNTSLTGGKSPWPDFVNLAGATGFSGCDVNLAGAMKEGVEATRGVFAKNKLRASFCSLPLTVTRDEETFRKGLAALDEAAAFASAIDCKRMMTVMPASSATPKAEFRKILRDRFAAVGEILQKHEIRVGLEFLGPLHFRTSAQYPFIWRMDEMLELAKECGPNIGLTLDCWHWHHSGSTAGNIVAAGRSRIILLHLSDSAKLAPEDVRDNQRLLPGEGVIDFGTFFGALKQIGYDGSVSPEPIGRIPKEATAAEGARMGLAATLAVMRRVGVA